MRARTYRSLQDLSRRSAFLARMRAQDFFEIFFRSVGARGILDDRFVFLLYQIIYADCARVCMCVSIRFIIGPEAMRHALCAKCAVFA